MDNTMDEQYLLFLTKGEAKKNELFTLVTQYSDRIQNGRTDFDVFYHGVDEMCELSEEMHNKENPGPDGIVGEAIDVILCMMDLIHLTNPTLDSIMLSEMAQLKLKKWEKYYSHSLKKLDIVE